MGGSMHVPGEPDGPPISVGLPICDLGTGMWAVQGILAAPCERQRTGTGLSVEKSARLHDRRSACSHDRKIMGWKTQALCATVRPKIIGGVAMSQLEVADNN